MPDNKGVTPLIAAANSNNLAIVELLLRNRADANARGGDGWTALHFAVVSAPECATILIEFGAELNLCEEEGDSPLIAAVKVPEMSRVDLVKQLLEHGANPNLTGRPDGLRPVHFAAFLGHTEILQLLVSCGADVNAMTHDGNTPLDLAVEFERFETANTISLLGGKKGK